MISQTTLDALLAAGASAEMIVAAVKAEIAAHEAAEAEKKQRQNELAAERQRRKRAKDAASSRAVTDVTRDERDASEPRVCAQVVNTLEVKKDTLPTCPSDTTVPMPKPKPRRALPEGWPVDGFDRWWAVYPRRTAKGDAEKAFATAARRGDVTFSDLMAATTRFARSPPDAQFTPHPATWLNGKRYLDEPDTIHRASQRPDSHPGSRRKHTMASVELEDQAWAKARERGGPVGFDRAFDRSGTLDLGPLGASAFGLDGASDGRGSPRGFDADVVRLHVAGGRGS